MKTISTLRCVHLVRIAFSLVLLAAFLVTATIPARGAPQLTGNINMIYVSNVTDVDFQVTWTTDAANNNSSVNFGTTPGNLDQSAVDDVTVSSTTHSVYIFHGLPDTPIYFEVVSGGETDDNNGAKYQVTSGAVLGIPPSGKDIKGTVYKSDGTTPAANVIVYIQLQDANGAGSLGSSQWGTALTASNGTWIYNLDGLRTADASAYFTETYGTDNMRLIWQGGNLGDVGEAPGDERIYTTPTTFPGIYNMTLDGIPTAVTMIGIRAYNSSQTHYYLVLGLVLISLVILGMMIGLFWLGKSRKATGA